MERIIIREQAESYASEHYDELREKLYLDGECPSFDQVVYIIWEQVFEGGFYDNE